MELRVDGEEGLGPLRLRRLVQELLHPLPQRAPRTPAHAAAHAGGRVLVVLRPRPQPHHFPRAAGRRIRREGDLVLARHAGDHASAPVAHRHTFREQPRAAAQPQHAVRPLERRRLLAGGGHSALGAEVDATWQLGVRAALDDVERRTYVVRGRARLPQPCLAQLGRSILQKVELVGRAAQLRALLFNTVHVRSARVDEVALLLRPAHYNEQSRQQRARGCHELANGGPPVKVAEMDETLREAEQMTVRLLDDRVDEIRERNAHDAGQGLHNRRLDTLSLAPVTGTESGRELTV